MALPVLRRNDQGLTRWDPFEEFSRVTQEINRLSERLFGETPLLAGAFRPLADVEETDDAYLVEVELPGIKPDDVTVEVQGRRIMVHGERKERERKGIFRTQTRTSGRFHFETVLATEIDEEGVSANLSEGVLTVRVPKSETERRKTIGSERAEARRDPIDGGGASTGPPPPVLLGAAAKECRSASGRCWVGDTHRGQPQEAYSWPTCRQ